MMLTSDIHSKATLPSRQTLAVLQFSDQTQELPSREGAGNLYYFGNAVLFVQRENGIPYDRSIKDVLDERQVIFQNGIHICSHLYPPANPANDSMPLLP